MNNSGFKDLEELKDEKIVKINSPLTLTLNTRLRSVNRLSHPRFAAVLRFASRKGRGDSPKLLNVKNLVPQCPSALVTSKKAAFTLAEVLITLGVIGIVAALTIPNVMSNYKKQKTSAKLKKFYSIMNQAITLSEVDNGPAFDWEKEATAKDENGQLINEEQVNRVDRFFKRYLAPYMVITKEETSKIKENMKLYYLADGSAFRLNNGLCMHFIYFTDGNEKKAISGVSRFEYLLCNEQYNNIYHPRNPKHAFGPYGSFYQTREQDKEACKTNSDYCAGLLQWDNWEFKDDYPYKL